MGFVNIFGCFGAKKSAKMLVVDTLSKGKDAIIKTSSISKDAIILVSKII